MITAFIWCRRLCAAIRRAPGDYLFVKGVWYCVGHSGGADWRLRPRCPDGDQGHRQGLLPQKYGLWCGVLSVYHDRIWHISGGSGPGFPGPIEGMEHQVNSLPWAELGELWGCCRRKMDPTCWHLTSSLYSGSLNWLGGGPGTIPGPGPHRVRGPQRWHRPRPEPVQAAGCWYSDWVQSSGPTTPLPEELEIISDEYMVTGT